jgi:hypothetical protein
MAGSLPPAHWRLVAGSAASARTQCTAPRLAPTARVSAWTWTRATPSRAGRSPSTACMIV